MNLRKLEVFCKVVELKSFTKAADIYSISQPSVSEQIRSLEYAYKEKLLERNGGVVLPTQAGRILYDHTLDMLRLHQQTIVAMQARKSNEMTGRVSVGASMIPGNYILPQHIGAFSRKYPDVRIALNIDTSKDIACRVATRELDFGIVSDGWKDPRLEWEKLFDEQVVCAVYPDHPLAHNGSVRLDDLRDQPFLHLEKSTGTRRFVNALLKNSGLPSTFLRVAAEMSNIEAVRRGIKAGMGISLLPEHALREDVEAAALKAIPVEQADMQRPYYIVTRRGQHLETSCEVFRSHLAGAVRTAR